MVDSARRLCIRCQVRPDAYGEGEPLCRPCLYRRAWPAGHVEELTMAEARHALRGHPNVTYVVNRGHARWVWSTAWPKEKDASLLSKS